MGKRIYLTVTNDLTYDQRMQRICRSLVDFGYTVTLVGRRRRDSRPLQQQPFRQKRIRCWFQKGKWFYREYNLRLLFFLLTRRMEAICAIDLDTILPCLYVSRSKRIPRVLDAHELFTELKEVFSRPAILDAWMRIEKKAVPQFPLGYTVSEGLANEFQKRYGVHYETIRNLPRLRPLGDFTPRPKTILFQGAVNEGRAFEQLIPVMKSIDARLIVCGDGNFMPALKKLIEQHGVAEKVELKGMMTPEELWPVARTAWMGIGLAEKEGLNQWYALPNKFLDYIHAALPQVSMNYPEYRRINDQFGVALLIDSLSTEEIGAAINKLLVDNVVHERLRRNCLIARESLNWEHEEKKLEQFYKKLFAGGT